MPPSTVDPEVALFVERVSRAWSEHPPLASLSIGRARAVAEAVREPWRRGGPVMASVREIHAPTSTGPLRVRLYDPGVAAPSAVLVYLHGGGFTFFSLDTHDRLMREYAAAAGLLVAGVDYPLAPEARYPTALDQVVQALEWLAGPAGAELGIDAARIAMGGDSAGANLCVASALRLRDSGRTGLVRALLLNYGAFGAPCSDAAESALGGAGAVLNRAEMEYYFANYLGAHDARPDDPYARPIVADLAGLPPSFLVIPDQDVLAEQSRRMAERLEDAGVSVQAREYAGATHSFLEAMSISALAREAIADGARFVQAALA